MAASPFAFLRGAAAVMAWDRSHTSVSGLSVLINGDAHINNVGLYGTPQRDVIVDLNDFDEAYPGPWEWDLKRLVASVNVAGAGERPQPERAAAGGHGGGRGISVELAAARPHERARRLVDVLVCRASAHGR